MLDPCLNWCCNCRAQFKSVKPMHLDIHNVCGLLGRSNCNGRTGQFSTKRQNYLRDADYFGGKLVPEHFRAVQDDVLLWQQRGSNLLLTYSARVTTL